jgi:hypothetical protein
MFKLFIGSEPIRVFGFRGGCVHIMVFWVPTKYSFVDTKASEKKTASICRLDLHVPFIYWYSLPSIYIHVQSINSLLILLFSGI